MDGTFNMTDTHMGEELKLPRIMCRWQSLRKTVKSKLCFQYTVPSEPTYSKLSIKRPVLLNDLV